jgi:hypothetical protein
VNGVTFAHGTTRLNLAKNDLEMFVDPPDAALMFGFRALDVTDPFEKSFPVWMATMRRRGGQDAIVESLQRVFTQLADEGSLARLFLDLCGHARSLGYEKIWIVPAASKEPLLAPALKPVTEQLGRPIAIVPTSGMIALNLGTA